MNQLELAWAVGLFEGEGSCGLAKSGKSVQPFATLEMSDEDIVRKFHAIIGVGNVYALTQRRGNKPIYAWKVSSQDDVLAALSLLWPHLGERRSDQAIRVIERIAKLKDGRGWCHRGHQVTGENATKDGKCRTCQRDYQRERRKRLAVSA